MIEQCQTLVAHCMDYRIQEFIHKWLKDNLPIHSYDRVSLAGGVHDFYSVLQQFAIADRLHGITEVVFINHEDCGAYGVDGDRKRHEADLNKSGEMILKLYPHLTVSLFYLKLDGTFDRVE